jgi:hypothetical protein
MLILAGPKGSAGGVSGFLQAVGEGGVATAGAGGANRAAHRAPKLSIRVAMQYGQKRRSSHLLAGSRREPVHQTGPIGGTSGTTTTGFGSPRKVNLALSSAAREPSGASGFTPSTSTITI